MSGNGAALHALWSAMRAAAEGGNAVDPGDPNTMRFEFGDEVIDAWAEAPRQWGDLAARLNVLAKNAGLAIQQPMPGALGRGPAAKQEWLRRARANVNRLLETIRGEPSLTEKLIPPDFFEAEAEAELAELESRQLEYESEMTQGLSLPADPRRPPEWTGDAEALLANPDMLKLLVRWGEQYVRGAPDVLQALFLQIASVVAPPIWQGEVAHRGAIHVLLAGEFATVKSGILGLAQMIAPRAMPLDSVTFPGFVGTFRGADGDRVFVPGAAARADRALLIVDEFDKSVARDSDLDAVVRTVMTHRPFSRVTAHGEIYLHARPAILAAANPQNDLFLDGAMREQLNQPLGVLSRWDFIRPLVQTTESTNSVLDLMAAGWFEPLTDRGEGADITMTAGDVKALFATLYRAVEESRVQRVRVPPEFKRTILAAIKQNQREVNGVPVLSPRDLEGAFRFLQASAILHLRQRVVHGGVVEAAAPDLDVALEMLTFQSDVRAKMFETNARRALSATPFDRAYAWVKTELERAQQMGELGVDYQDLVEGLARTRGIGRSTAYRWMAEFVERDETIACSGLRNGLVRQR